MKILITGIKGFIGNHVMDLFKEKTYDVVGWDIFDGDVIYPICDVDMLDRKAVETQLNIEKPDLIIHCAGAADVGKSIENPYNDYMVNVTVTHNLLFSLYQVGLLNTRVIFISSAAVYGNPKTLPIIEESELNPLSPYALHKIMCENICMYMRQNFNLDIKILRVFSAYGKGLEKQIFWDMYQKYTRMNKLPMYGTGFETRDYINIEDLAQAIFLVAMKAPRSEMVYNIANGEEVTIRQAVEFFAEAVGANNDVITFNGERMVGHPTNWKADITKLKLLGYEKNVDLHDGIHRYIKEMEMNEV